MLIQWPYFGKQLGSAMQALTDTGGMPSSHICCRQRLSAASSVVLPVPGPTFQLGQVFCAPRPLHEPAEPCATLLSPSLLAPLSEQLSCAFVARISGARLSVARCSLMVSTHTCRR